MAFHALRGPAKEERNMPTIKKNWRTGQPVVLSRGWPPGADGLQNTEVTIGE
jgi:hypothetical protein